MRRIIYNLRYELDVPEGITELIIPPDSRGGADECDAVDSNKRIIDLRAGDEFICKGKLRKIKSIVAERSYSSATNLRPNTAAMATMYASITATRTANR